MNETMMTLDEWLWRTKTKRAALARQLNVSRTTVHAWLKWESGERGPGAWAPSDLLAQMIERITGGSVPVRLWQGSDG